MDNTDNPGFITRLQNWVMHPLANQMDMLDVVLAVLLIATIAAAWIVVLKHLTSGE